MPDPSDVTGLILAGGRSRRFGRDKALADVGGRSFVEYVYDALAAHAGSVLIATGPTQRLYPVPARVVLDGMPDGGPLAGLVAGLDAASTPWLLSAAVDQPYLTAAALRPLLAALRGGADVLVAVDAGGRRQPTCALWRVATAGPAARTALEARQLALRELWEGLEVREVGLERGALRNVNTPGDLG